MSSGPSSILVTGVTGFLGREVTRRLLVMERPVLALARRRCGESAADRVGRAVGFAPDGRVLDVVEGDLAQPGLGLNGSDWRRLAAVVETVIHCAGDTTFFPEEMDRFRAGHIGGPLAILRALSGGRLRRWVQLSTAYVCGAREGTVLEGEGDVGQRFHNPYEQVKLEAEQILRGAGEGLGVEVRVFRPSIVVGAAPETGGGNPSNLFFAFIRMVAALARLSSGSPVTLRIAAAPRASFNIVPVEAVAAAVVALADLPDARGATLHLVVPDAPTQERILALIAERLGVSGLRLVDARRGPLDHPSSLERRVARMLSGYRHYLEQDVRFDDSAARRLLDRCGMRPPVLSNEAVHRLVDLALAGGDGRRAPLADPERAMLSLASRR